MNESFRNREYHEAALTMVRYAGIALPDRPRLAPWLVLVDLGDSRLQLRSAESSYTLTHPLLIKVFRRIETILDGMHSVDDIVSGFDDDVLPTTVVFLLKLLQANGLLQPGPGETELGETEQARWQRQLRFLGHFVPDAPSAQGRLAKARVGLVGSSDLKHAVLSAIDSTGVGAISELAAPATWSSKDLSEVANLDLIVACEEAPAFSFFEAVNRACLATGNRWLRVAISGTSAQLGPTVVPNQTACYTCFDLRLRTHQPELEGYIAYRAHLDRLGSGADEGKSTPLWLVVAGQAGLEVVRLLIGFSPPVTIGRFYELSASSPLTTAHDVFKVPRCPSCGRRRTFSEAWDQDFRDADTR